MARGFAILTPHLSHFLSRRPGDAILVIGMCDLAASREALGASPGGFSVGSGLKSKVPKTVVATAAGHVSAL